MSGASLWACFLLVALLVSCSDAVHQVDHGLELDAQLEDQAIDQATCLPRSAPCTASSCCSGLCGPASIGSAATACLEPCTGTTCPPEHSCQGLETDAGYRAVCVPLGAP